MEMVNYCKIYQKVGLPSIVYIFIELENECNYPAVSCGLEPD